MNMQFVLLLTVYLAVLALSAPWVGRYLAAAVSGGLSRGPLAQLESGFYRICGVRPQAEMTWRAYMVSVLLFSVAGVFAVYLLQRFQAGLPLNPQGLGNVSPDSSFNTAVSFVTNTNWQGYGGESTMSYLTQMLALTVQNFLSAATGIAVAFALIRGLTRKLSDSIGNFWTDVTRITLYVLLPCSVLLALALVGQGMIQNLNAYVDVAPIDTAAQAEQRIAMGPVASQVAIKMLGTNGGGFFNANASHPFENPTGLSNFLQMLAIFLIPSGLCSAFGQMAGDRRQGWALWAAMAVIFVGCALGTDYFEQRGNPALTALGADQAASELQPGGNMEGKEARFGISNTALFATITTSASCGAVNGMHDSFTPLGGLFPMWLMQLGEVVFGGVGSGLYGMLIFALIAVFVAGLMIGRTPEYLGKKIEPFEMKMAALAILVTPLLVLLGTAIAVMAGPGRAGVLNPGAHGFSEILYALSSAANNNGSAFAGLSANTPFYNVLLALAMWFGRFGVIVPVLAAAGSLAKKKTCAQTAGSLPTHGPLFVVLLVSTVLLVGALTYVPALALGPVVEHLQVAAN
jgi:K+-transporting ATPase ATPase A chain